MATLGRGQASGCANPALDIYTSVAGQAIDVEVLEFQIFDVSTPAKRAAPVQVFPPAGRQPVDTASGCPAGGRLGTGHYVAAWTVPEDEPLGAHEIRWFFRLTADAPEHTFVEEFDVVAVPTGGGATGYCTVEDLRAEGVTEQEASDARLWALIDEASRTIDRACGWFFEPRLRAYRLDGRDAPSIEPPAPPIRIDRLAVGGAELSLDPDDLVVVSAPVQPGFDGPRLTLRHGRFPRGRGNVVAEGLWGYTEDDGTPTGRTPLEIRRACMLLVLRWLHPLTADASTDARNRWRILEERTRDQSYKLDRAGAAGPFTGDPEIDAILARYRRPLALGGA